MKRYSPTRKKFIEYAGKSLGILLLVGLVYQLILFIWNYFVNS